MNSYARLTDVQEDVNMGETRAASLLRVLEDASRAVDDAMRRHFWAWRGERLFDGSGRHELWIDDAVSIEGIGVHGIWEAELEPGDWTEWPANRIHEPVQRIAPHHGTQLTRWPRGTQNVRISGLWGYSYERAHAGKLAAPVSLDAVVLELAGGHSVSPGDTLVVGGEQMDVQAVGENIVVERGINGTVAEEHVSAKPVYRRRYPRPIERATAMQAMRTLTGQSTGYAAQVGDPQYGGFSMTSLYPQIRDYLAPYRQVMAPNPMVPVS